MGKLLELVPLVDNGDLVRNYSLVSAANAKTFAPGDTQKGVFKKYKNALSKEHQKLLLQEK